MPEIYLKEESYQVIGVCMEVHKHLGMGFKEVLYKDALQIEFKNKNIPFDREKKYNIEYKGLILPHKYFADFVLHDQIILEVKSANTIVDAYLAQTINYLKASGIKLGIIANFGERSFTYKRVIF
jgi:GxxExxY protein